MKVCKHNKTSNFSSKDFEGNVIDHHYCHGCKGHFFRGKFLSKIEWEKEIESFDYKAFRIGGSL